MIDTPAMCECAMQVLLTLPVNWEALKESGLTKAVFLGLPSHPARGVKTLAESLCKRWHNAAPKMQHPRSVHALFVAACCAFPEVPHPVEVVVLHWQDFCACGAQQQAPMHLQLLPCYASPCCAVLCCVVLYGEAGGRGRVGGEATCTSVCYALWCPTADVCCAPCLMTFVLHSAIQSLHTCSAVVPESQGCLAQYQVTPCLVI